MRQVSLDFDPQGVEKSRRPALLEQAAATVTAKTEDGQRNDQAADNKQRHPELAEGANGSAGLVQAVYPR